MFDMMERIAILLDFNLQRIEGIKRENISHISSNVPIKTYIEVK